METVKRSVAARGWGEGGMNQQSTEDFQGSETILYEITRHYTFVIMYNGGYMSLYICQNS